MIAEDYDVASARHYAFLAARDLATVAKRVQKAAVLLRPFNETEASLLDKRADAISELRRELLRIGGSQELRTGVL